MRSPTKPKRHPCTTGKCFTSVCQKQVILCVERKSSRHKNHSLKEPEASATLIYRLAKEVTTPAYIRGVSFLSSCTRLLKLAHGDQALKERYLQPQMSIGNSATGDVWRSASHLSKTYSAYELNGRAMISEHQDLRYLLMQSFMMER